MSDKLTALRGMLADGSFHHATHRLDSPSLWNGLWIYKRDSAGFAAYSPAFCFYEGDPQQSEAHELVRHTGVSVGARGEG